MDYMTNKDTGQESDPHAGQSDIHATHDRHAGHSVAMFRDKFWLSFALTIPVVFWSADVQHWLGYTAPPFLGSKFIPPILGTCFCLWRPRFHPRGMGRTCRSQARHDDAYQLENHSCICHFSRCHVRLSRH
jgi:Cu2+-exporting ATPase